MLITLTIQNWMSFRDKTTFSMVASKEQQHGNRLAKLSKYRMRTLPTAIIYGGNASGKTNLFMSIAFARQFIIRRSQQEALIAVEPFQLDESNIREPSKFTFEILIEDDLYEFSFSITTAKVLEEKLVQRTSTREKVLYHRLADDRDPHFHSSVNNQRLRFTFEGTRDNQLFLSNSVSQKRNEFRPIYDWFDQTLVLVGPNTRFEAFEHFVTEGSPLSEKMNVLLPNLDTGISKLGGEEISLDRVSLPEPMKQDLKENVKNGMAVKINSVGEKFIISRKDDKLSMKKIYTYHQNSHGKNVRFEMKQESDGSKRIIDLLPAFLDLAYASIPRVYIIDEMDRSLHSLLTLQLLKFFLSGCSNKSRKQLLFTTHDLMLMNQNFFRRDEIWITQRKKDGSSKLISFAEYDDTRNDKDIRKSYLQGRMGGIPNIIADQILAQSHAGETPA